MVWIEEPLDKSAKANRLCFRTERMEPWRVMSLPSISGLTGGGLDRICAPWGSAAPGTVRGLVCSLATDVVKARRHICMFSKSVQNTTSRLWI